ncbi:MAG: esterase-like activity of phytase family protein [Rhodospirillaceae bacterium]|nr:esterase-like activity of phytase family protein [Rhodospirillaceae bacterium]
MHAAAMPQGEPIIVDLQPVPLEPRADNRRAGELEYLAGYVLTSGDGGWGGFSGLVVSRDGGRLVAVSDEGLWLEARLTHEGDRMVGLDAALLAPMLDVRGDRLLGKRMTDAEGLAAEADGAVLVTFERAGRLWRYRPAGSVTATAAEPVPSPLDGAVLPENGGVGAVAALADGTIVMLAAGPAHGAPEALGWIGRAGGPWAPVHWMRTGLFRVTDATALPSGDLLVLERRFTSIGGPAARLSVVPRAALRPGTHLAGREIALLHLPMTVDNFEAVAARPGAGGTLVYLMSDDNRSPVQRTLLLEFLWRGH